MTYKMQSLAAAAIVLAIGTSVAQGATIGRPGQPDPNAVVDQLTQRMDAVAAYSARVHVGVQLHSFPFLAANLDGTTTYARPGHYTVTFDSVPGLASAFQNVSGDIGDPAAWRSKYAIAIVPAAAADPPNTLALRLTEKVKGQLDHALAYVDESSETVTRMEWYYANGGRIAVEQHFAPIHGVLLVDSQAADIDMPGYKATAHAVFDGYAVQVGAQQTPGASSRN